MGGGESVSEGETGTDLREGGRWSLAQRAKNDVLWFMVQAALATMGRLPPRALYKLGVALGVVAHAAIPSARRIAQRNVALVFPELEPAEQRALVARSYRTLGGYLG